MTLNSKKSNFSNGNTASNSEYNTTRNMKLSTNKQSKLIEFSKIISQKSKLSEKEEESSTNTQETILKKPNDLIDSLNYSDRIETVTSIDRIFYNNKNPLQFSKNSLQNSIVTHKDDMRSSVTSKNFGQSKSSYNPFLVLKNHLDSVRQIYISPDSGVLVSVGEDTLINYWDIKKIIKNNKEVCEPFFTQRIHTTPIFTLSGPEYFNYHSNEISENNHPCYIYTSGMDGVIRSTKLIEENLDPNSVNLNLSTNWRAHQDMIWDLNHHPQENFLCSLSSDGTVKISKGCEEKNVNITSSYHSSKNQVKQLIFKNTYYNLIEIPTASYWSRQNNSIFVSYVAPYIKLFDLESGKTMRDFSFNVGKNIPFECQQTNRIIEEEKLNILISAHEDRNIRFFDCLQNKLVNNIVAHTDSVSTLCQGLRDYEFFSGSHDGSLRCWDLRMFKLLYDIPAHRKKYDEGLLSIKIIKESKLVLTSGADGIIKAFNLIN
jgi:striatin 1/3/4